MPKHGGHQGVEAFGLGALSAGAVISAVAGGYKFAEFLVKAKKLREVKEENALFVRIMQRVRVDLAETERLLALAAVKRALSRSPAKVTWIRETIRKVREALEEMGRFTRRVQLDVEAGKRVGLRSRFRWVLNDHEKVVHARMELAMNHLGLIQVLGFLSGLEPLACCPPDGDFEAADRYVEETDVKYRDEIDYERPRYAAETEDEGFYEREVEVRRDIKGGGEEYPSGSERHFGPQDKHQSSRYEEYIERDVGRGRVEKEEFITVAEQNPVPREYRTSTRYGEYTDPERYPVPRHYPEPPAGGNYRESAEQDARQGNDVYREKITYDVRQDNGIGQRLRSAWRPSSKI